MVRKTPKPPAVPLVSLRDWRIARGYTGLQMAERMSLILDKFVSDTTITRVERGLNGYSPAFLDAAARALEIPPEALLVPRDRYIEERRRLDQIAGLSDRQLQFISDFSAPMLLKGDGEK